MPTKERTKENCRCCDAADPRLRGCTPLRTPIRKSEGSLATRTQYYCSRLTPTGLPPLLSRVLRGCERGATVERSETGERAMFAPAWQTTARAGLRSKLAALVVRRQAPPNPRRGEVEAPLSKGDSPLRGEMSRSDRGARARRAGRVSGPGDSDGPYVTTRSRATTRQLGRGGLPPSLAPLVHNDSRQSVGAGHARPAALLCCPSTG